KRAAAEELGRIGDPKCVPTILEQLAHEKNDRVLDHSLTYALIEIGDVKATREGLKSQSPHVRGATIAALAGMPERSLTRADFFGDLESPDSALRDTAWWVAAKRPELNVAECVTLVCDNKLRTIAELTPQERSDLEDRIVGFMTSETMQ